MNEVYLDYNATTPIDERVLQVMVDTYRFVPGNADSRTHDFGEKALQVVENARKQVGELFGVRPDEIFFTGGATESNNLAIQGIREYAEQSGKKHIVSTSIEHKSVLNTVKYMGTQGFETDFISPDDHGRISAENLLSKIRKDTVLVSVMHVNNETGMIQPVAEIGEELEKRKVLFHVDATQSAGKLVDEIRDLKYDMLSFSAHKFRGPQGIGALILRRKGYKLPPVKQIMYGGQQEHGLRPGTTPVALVAGLGEACRLAGEEYKKNENDNKRIKEGLLQILNNSNIHYTLNGDQRFCVSSTMNISFTGVSSEALMIATRQYCAISNGSACTSKSYAPSYVLKAMNIPVAQIENSVRISWGAGVSQEDVLSQFKMLIETVKKLA